MFLESSMDAASHARGIISKATCASALSLAGAATSIVTKICLCQTRVCHDKYLSRQKCCRDKHNFVATKVLSVATSILFATKMILVVVELILNVLRCHLTY